MPSILGYGAALSAADALDLPIRFFHNTPSNQKHDSHRTAPANACGSGRIF